MKVCEKIDENDEKWGQKWRKSGMDQAFFGHFGVKMRGQKGSKWGPEPFLGVPRKRGIFGVFLGFWKYRVFGVFLGFEGIDGNKGFL